MRLLPYGSSCRLFILPSLFFSLLSLFSLLHLPPRTSSRSAFSLISHTFPFLTLLCVATLDRNHFTLQTCKESP